MPIHEYECRACGHQFELLRLPSNTAAPQCPACQSQELERLLSGFAVSSEATRQTNLSKARRRYAADTNLKDKKIAEGEEVREHLMDDYGVDPTRKVTPLGQK